jgi:isoleucyl-tRNA synthetase
MFQSLVRRPAHRSGIRVPESVHLATFPRVGDSPYEEALRQESSVQLSAKVKTVRELVRLGLQVRNEAKIRVRQPLRSAYGIVVDPSRLRGSATLRLQRELNVLAFHAVGVGAADRFVEFRVKPNFRALGQRGLGKDAQRLKRLMAELTSLRAAELGAEVLAEGIVTFEGVRLSRGDVDIEFIAKEGFAAAAGRVGVVVLDTKLDSELEDLGMLRELQSRIQAARKEMGLEYTDRIALSIGAPERLARVVAEHRDELLAEVLGDSVSFGAPAAGAHVEELDLEGSRLVLGIRRT